jgi:CBS domain-containing protein
VQVRDVMSSPVISVRPHVPVGGAAALLVSHGFTAVPVVDAEGRLRGLVTEAELMRGRIAADGEPVDDRAATAAGPPVSTVMTPRPHVVEADADLADVAALMLRTRTRALPVLNGGKLVGMITHRDLLRVVATRALEAAQAGR